MRRMYVGKEIFFDSDMVSSRLFCVTARGFRSVEYRSACLSFSEGELLLS